MSGHSRAPLAVGVLLVLSSLYFLLNSVNLMSSYKVAAGLLAALIGFILLTYGVALLRSYVLAKASSEASS